MRVKTRITVAVTLVLLFGSLRAETAADQVAFSTETIADGVLLLRPAATRPDLSNSLVVEREDGLLVVGPQASVDGARELLAAIAGLGGKPVRYLVLTNAHADAAGGASEFPESTLVIATVNARDALRDPAHDFGAEVRLRSTDPKNWQAPPIRLPVLIVHARTELEDPINEVELLPLAHAHTTSDLLVFLPNQNILYCGAVLFPDRNPYAADGDVGSWLSTLNHISKMNPAVAIPLRGDALDARQVRELRDVLAWVRGQVDLAFVNRVAPEQMTEQILASDDADKYFDLDASPSFVETVVDQAVEEAIAQRKKRGLM